MERSSSRGATCPARARSHVASKPKTNPPTWAKNAAPPLFAGALNSPKLASIKEDREDPRPDPRARVEQEAGAQHGGDAVPDSSVIAVCSIIAAK
jgi:hypothetical protein